eukprot:CAMPEP_0197029014 /NCGR_PEP_ID=MMETSP1384-20130603/8562_1 /TAXON_ID=29189 /ORGANISM="Ammonia sp." /LENGTH=219 /DNA_ID=CAMNT_0042458109 /DNA_START=39 /DNA_END=695 /DNA_ORIENTATION=+
MATEFADWIETEGRHPDMLDIDPLLDRLQYVSLDLSAVSVPTAAFRVNSTSTSAPKDDGNSEQTKFILTHNVNNSTTTMCEPPSPESFATYLEEHYEILRIIDDDNNEHDGECVLFSEKGHMIKELIITDLKKKHSFTKYLFAFRIFAKQFICKKVVFLGAVLSHCGYDCAGDDVLTLLLTFVYDGMCYLQYSTQDSDLEFINDSLDLYSYLSPSWRTW